MWVTARERLVLAVLGTLAVAGLGLTLWQQRRAPLAVEQGPEPPSAQWDAAIRDARQVDLNTATVRELERLPQIGPSLARRIVAYRHAHGLFRRPEELREVPGIGPKTYEALKDDVTVR